MDMKRNKLIGLLSLCLLAATFASCEDWNETEAVKQKVERPEDQNPELWAEYTAALRDYKQSEHFIVYARLFNSPQPGTSEKDFMRCLPDSLDIVSLTNADNFSKYDAEDMLAMREKGTKVLYQVDYAGRSGELTDETKLGAYLDKVIAAVEKNGLDGYSFTGIPNAGDAATATAAALIVERLSAAKTEGQLLVFEGNPLFLTADALSKVDYVVLDTEATENVTDLKMQVLNATGYAGVPATKLLLAAAAGAPLYDENVEEHAAITEMAERVVSLGPLAGLGTYDIYNDYYDLDMNYKLVRNAIQTLNPSK